MSKHLPTRLSGRDRAIRIELLRARAAIERQGLAHGVTEVRHSLTPRGLLEAVLPRGRSRRRPPSDLLMQAFSFSRRYPMMLSLGSALISTAARRRLRWWKLAAGAVIAWQVARNRRN